jgi:ankyrin repeat protein
MMRNKKVLFGFVGMVTGCLLFGSAFAGQIHDAVWDMKPAAVKAMLKKSPALVNDKDPNGASPLHYAVSRGYQKLVATDRWATVCPPEQKEVVTFLLSKGADVNAKDNDAATPLHWAAFKENMVLAELLISHGADVNAKDRDGITPLDLAKLRGNKEMQELLRKHGAKE